MSECVVRMEMPENCDVCPCLDDYGDYPRCRISGEQRGYNFPICEKRMPNCPIICKLPEGHGRLVEAKALFERVYEYYGQDNESNENWMMEMINGAPTIVPAERSET